MEPTKRQVLPSGLWVVATPIGNLMDLTPRGIQALEEADFILCEDTRRTAVLLDALGIQDKNRLVRLDAHASDHQIETWAKRICEKGVRVALVSDAGTPGVSDPGAKLVEKIYQENGDHKTQVVPIPGASAVLALLSVAGFHQTPFAFRGFFPRSEKDKKQELLLACESKLARICVWFESPFRILDTLSLIERDFPDTRVVVAKELTKIHEKIRKGTASEIFQWVREEVETEGTVGEWCLAVEFPVPDPADAGGTEGGLPVQAQETLKCLLESGVSVSEASRNVSRIFGVSKKGSYALALKLQDVLKKK